MNAFRQYINFNANTTQSSQEPPQTQSPTPTIQKIECEKFSDSLYEECVKERQEVIFVMNLNDYKESFREDLEGSLLRISQLKQYFSKKKLRFLKLDFENEEAQKKFEEKHNVKITRNTIFLIKNRYNESLLKFSIQDYFSKKDYLLMIFAKLRKLSAKNYGDFSKFLKDSTNDTLVILLYNPKESAEYENLKKKFSNLATDQRFLGQTNISFLMIKETQISKNLQISESEAGDLFLMQKSSKLNFNKFNFELNPNLQFHIQKSNNLKKSQSNLDVLEQIVLTSQKTNVFSLRGLESNGSDYSFNLEIDLNKLDDRDLKQLYDVMADVKSELMKKIPNIEETMTFNKISKSLKTEGIKISIRNEQKLFKNLMEREAQSMKDLESLYGKEKVPEINEPASFTYVFGKKKDLTKESILNFIEEVREGKVKPNYETQKPPKFRAFSRKVVGKTFKKDIIENEKNQILFIYSKHCHACKRFGQIYEDLALENLKAGRTDVEFNRMNSDHNEVDCMRRFNYTPVFLVFKAGSKKNPCIYLSEKMTPELLKAFVENSVRYKELNDEMLKIPYEQLKRENKSL